jgi:hypothetical protein
MAKADGDVSTIWVWLSEAFELFEKDHQISKLAKTRLVEFLGDRGRQGHWSGTLHTSRKRGKRDTDPGEGTPEFWRHEAGSGEKVRFDAGNLEQSWVRRTTYEPSANRVAAHALGKVAPQPRLRSRYAFTHIKVSLNALSTVSLAAAQRLAELAREAAPPPAPPEVQPSPPPSPPPALTRPPPPGARAPMPERAKYWMKVWLQERYQQHCPEGEFPTLPEGVSLTDVQRDLEEVDPAGTVYSIGSIRRALGRMP